MGVEFPSLIKGRTKGLEKQVKDIQRWVYLSGAIDTNHGFWSWREVKAKGLSPNDPEDVKKAIDVWADGDFGEATEDAVSYCQLRYVNKQGFFLSEVERDGVVGLDTWDVADKWLRGEYYTQNIPPEISAKVKSITDNNRFKVLNEAYKYLGVTEHPKGSNRGKEVDYFKGNTKNWAWCQCFVERVYKDVIGYYPIGPATQSYDKWPLTPSTAQARSWAKGLEKAVKDNKADWWKAIETIESEPPEPGDFYNLDNGRRPGGKSGTGHTGFVVGLYRKNGKIIGVYTISGNESDSVKEGLRMLNASTLAGFIDPYPPDCALDQDYKIIIDAENADKEKTT